ncbi:hypothetical protein [Serratia plymuthica]|uniref:hypothetical protein n=1 Tax=Serratia plymuthica TaxID=82996 RepID=UPI000AB6B1FF|nr:hypothetical protein [Serratia plymuthica]
MKMKFFTLDRTKRQIEMLKGNLAKAIPSDEFEKSKIDYIRSILDSFTNDDPKWDESTQFNIERIGARLVDTTITATNQDRDIDALLADCFRFFIERNISRNENFTSYYINFRDFVTTNKGKLSRLAENEVNYAITNMPIDIIQFEFNDENLLLIRAFIKSHKDNEQYLTQWQNELDSRKAEVDKLKLALEEQENAFNFVGLYKGFDDLGKIKEKESKIATKILLVLGFLIPIPIGLEFWFILFKSNSLTLTHSLITLIPSVSLILILIYYFRIALHDYKSIKTQVNQIELRKSLCKFIQNYAQYSAAIKKDDKSALEKFEAIIFSNIAMTDEKLPSTFDGIESIANLIKSAKG